MRVLIIEPGHSRGALAATRALGRVGWQVGIGSPRPGGLAASSRWCERWHEVPSPDQGADAMVAAIAQAESKQNYEVVFGCGDAEVLSLSKRRLDLAAVVPYGPHESVVKSFDKLHLARAAAALGVPTPSTVEATDEEVGKVDGSVLVKARSHWDPKADEGPLRMEAVAEVGAEAVRRRVAEFRAAGRIPLLQQIVAGRLVAYTVLVGHGGEVVAEVQQESDGLWPSSIGISVRARTVPVDPRLAEGARLLLAGLEWFGLAQVQFLVPEAGEPHLIDLNGRFYGSLALAIHAGISFPDLWARLATGRPLGQQPPSPAVCGRRYQWLEGDIRRAWEERRGGLGHDLAGCARYATDAAHSIIDRRDPWPATRYSLHLAARAARKTARSLRA